ncbi:MAG TPA: hypothetical protein PK054_05155 [Anaerohalosphaeraceae bacterium]|nr:hypothetical protein [Anaerohalosphaeraceae bacterium]HOL88767.1 hypothetical protein [Anaerohalosphaeraceae bacterium]HPP55952.1 hypothetical protein [Anaerohalosphaeraceae bacterium]
MEEIEGIRRLAEEVLTFQGPSGHSERWLWEKAARIARNAELITKLPELTKKGESFDIFSLLAAAYLSDAGYRLYSQVKGQTLAEAVVELRGRQLRDYSIQLVKEKETASLFKGKTDHICRIIAEVENRSTQLTEAKILSDARLLDEIGAIGLFQEIRRYFLQGKGAGALLEGWDRRIEYRYWEARLKEGFHYQTVRQIAQGRFAAMEQYIRQLRKEYLGQDLQNIELESFNTIS